MRKRLVIGAIAVVAIGVAAYFLSQPRKGTVAWHKKEYLALRYPKPPLLERIRHLPLTLSGVSLTGCFPPILQPDDPFLEKHLFALEQLRYLRRRSLEVTNNFGTNIAGQRLWRKAEEALPEHIWKVGITNGHMYLLYEVGDAARWEMLISEVNAESK